MLFCVLRWGHRTGSRIVALSERKVLSSFPMDLRIERLLIGAEFLKENVMGTMDVMQCS